MNRVTFFDISKSVVKIVFYLQKLKAKDSSILKDISKEKSISDSTDKALRETLDQLVKSYA